MSKNYLGRCAAVGIAGLTAMSSVAIVASAASQASVVYELKYNGIASVIMKTSVGYAVGTNEFCVKPSSSTVAMNEKFTVDLNTIIAHKAKYRAVTADDTKVVTANSYTEIDDTWTEDDFKDVSISAADTTWKYTYYDPADPANTKEANLDELYAVRAGSGSNVVLGFKTSSERSSAKSTITDTLKSEYGKLASAAAKQFKDDINAAAKNAKARLLDVKNTALDAAKTTLGTSTDAADKAIYNAAVQDANSKYNAAVSAVTSSASKIISEFNKTFTANSYNFDYAFAESNTPITLGSSIGGINVMDGAEYKDMNGNDVSVDSAKYWNGSTVRDASDTNAKSYLFAGEVQEATNFTNENTYLYLGDTTNWVNFEVLKNSSSNGGNTTTDGKTDSSSKSDTTTTTSTSWYPDSSTYRNPSEVSYLGENGSWYTSASAASVYGGGYTGTYKSSNYSSVNSSADGKAIYFNSSTGSYSTSSTSYSYVVKEATSSSNTSTSDDPYYSYFFNNGTSNSTTTTTAAAGSASIKGASKYAGWTNITSYITNKAKSGATYSINMNDETIVPSTVLAAAKAKNVTLTFINDNGSKVTVKPGKVSSDLDVSVTYSVKDIKTSLVNKAKKVNAGTVSTAQVRIGEDGSIGGTATVNVKFSTKRAGCKVKAYRLSESGSLVKTATGTINSSGRVNLSLTKGGSYLLVVIDD